MSSIFNAFTMRFTSLCIVLMAFISLSHAQNPPVVEERAVTMSTGLKNALVVYLSTSDADLVEDEQKKLFKGAKSKRNKKENETAFSKVDLSGVLGTSGPLVVYTRFDPSTLNNGTYYVWLQTEEGIWLNSNDHPNEIKRAKDWMTGFALQIKLEAAKRVLKKEEKLLEEQQSALKKLAREQEKSEKAIEEAKQRIAKEEESLRQNAVEQEKTRKAIQDQTPKVEEARTRLSELGGGGR